MSDTNPNGINSATEPETVKTIKAICNLDEIDGAIEYSVDGSLVFLGRTCEDESCRKILMAVCDLLWKVSHGEDISISDPITEFYFDRSFKHMQKRVQTFLNRQETAKRARDKRNGGGVKNG